MSGQTKEIYGNEKRAKGRRLNARGRLFVETLVYYGYKVAKELSNYSNTQLWRIMQWPETEDYRMKIMQEYLDKQGQNIEDLLQEYQALSKDRSIPGSTRAAVIKDLIQWYRQEKRDLEPHKQITWRPLAQLAPSKEVMLEEHKEEMNPPAVVEAIESGKAGAGLEVATIRAERDMLGLTPSEPAESMQESIGMVEHETKAAAKAVDDVKTRQEEG